MPKNNKPELQIDQKINNLSVLTLSHSREEILKIFNTYRTINDSIQSIDFNNIIDDLLEVNIFTKIIHFFVANTK